MTDPEFKWFEVTAYKPDGTKVQFDVITTYTDLKFAKLGTSFTSNVYVKGGDRPADDDLATAMTDMINATRTAVMRKFPG
jgi:hypothetical protein